MNIDYRNFNPHVIGCGYNGKVVVEQRGIEYPVRIVKWYELELYHEVKGGYIINMDHRVQLQKGMLMIRKPGTVVRGVASYECHSVCFDNIFDEQLEHAYSLPMFDNSKADVLEVVMNRLSDFLMNLPEVIMLDAYDEVTDIFKQLFACYVEQRTDYELVSKSLLYQLVAIIMNETDNGMTYLGADNKMVMALERTKQFMKRHYSNKIELKKLADMSNYSKEAYCRQFKSYYGKSPIEYLIAVRLSSARRQLITSNQTIEEIAHQTGFRNESYFYRQFKKRMAMTPKQYRNAHRIY